MKAESEAKFTQPAHWIKEEDDDEEKNAEAIGAGPEETTKAQDARPGRICLSETSCRFSGINVRERNRQ
jgi:hypothetical protein